MDERRENLILKSAISKCSACTANYETLRAVEDNRARNERRLLEEAEAAADLPSYPDTATTDEYPAKRVKRGLAHAVSWDRQLQKLRVDSKEEKEDFLSVVSTSLEKAFTSREALSAAEQGVTAPLPPAALHIHRESIEAFASYAFHSQYMARKSQENADRHRAAAKFSEFLYLSACHVYIEYDPASKEQVIDWNAQTLIDDPKLIRKSRKRDVRTRKRIQGMLSITVWMNRIINFDYWNGWNQKAFVLPLVGKIAELT